MPLLKKGQVLQLSCQSKSTQAGRDALLSRHTAESCIYLLALEVAREVMKLNLGKRSFKDVVVGDYDYKFLCMVRVAVDLFKLDLV